MANSIIAISDVSKNYGKGESLVRALDSVSLDIEAGEFVAITGPSGSGKSTIMNIIGCLDRPSKGRYLLDGVDVGQLNKDELAKIRNKSIGFVFQSYNLLARSSAFENVMLPIFYDRENKDTQEQNREKVLNILDKVGLADRINHLPHELSGGQAQRVAIARALVNDPVIILADEPTGNLDSKSGREIMALLSELNQQGRTIAMVTHDEKNTAHASRTVRFLDGHIENDGKHKKEKRAKRKVSHALG